MHIKTITQILEQINSGTLVNQFADKIYLALLTRVTNPAVCVCWTKGTDLASIKYPVQYVCAVPPNWNPAIGVLRMPEQRHSLWKI